MRFDLFSSGRLYAALREAGYPDLPAERTLRDWIKNDSAPNSARLAVAQLLDTTKEAPRPTWAEELMRKIDSIYDRQDIILDRQVEMARRASRSVIDALASPDVQEMRDELDALRSEQPPVEERRTEDSRPGK